MKVAILFWGLTRSTEYTIESIEKNIYNQLTDSDISYDVFIHTYSISGEYHNIHAKETITTYSHNSYNLLKPNYISIDNQETTIAELNLPQYRTNTSEIEMGSPLWKQKNTNKIFTQKRWGLSSTIRGLRETLTPPKNNFSVLKNQILDNFILAMNSKKKVTQMMENTEIIYDKVLFLRPDVRFLVPLNIDWIVNPDYNDKLLVPDFHPSGGINDRMACCSMNIAHIYGYIFDYLLEYSKHKPLHPETIHLFLMNSTKTPVMLIPFYFNRVRINGVENNDCPLEDIKTD